MDVKIPDKLQFRAEFKPGTVNVEKRTVDLIFVTETPVQRRDYNLGNDRNIFLEILSCKREHVNTQRLEAGAPLLNSHYKYSLADQLGVVEAFRFESGQMVATVRFATKEVNEEADRIFQGVITGIYRNVSCGYNVETYELVRVEGDVPVYRAIDWEVFELSMVTIQADPNSGVRSEENEISYRSVELRNSTNMSKTEEKPPVPTPEPQAPDLDKVRNEAVLADRKRSDDIRALAKRFEMDDDFTTRMINSENSMDQIRAEILEEKHKNDPNAVSGGRGSGADSARVNPERDEMRVRAMGDGIIMRAGRQDLLTPKELEDAQHFRGRRLLRVAEDCLRSAGISTDGLTDREIALRAMGFQDGWGQRDWTSTDLPMIFEAAMNKSLRMAYKYAPKTYEPIARRKDLPDFKDAKEVQIGDATSFAEVNEGAEITMARTTESRETWRLGTYGKRIPVTWQSIINDDMDALSRIPSMFANNAVVLQNDVVWGIILNNSLMGDGIPLFHADHGNLLTGANLSVTSLGAARAAMRRQKSKGDGVEPGKYINVQPRFLATGSYNETTALQVLNTVIVPTTTANANPYQNSMGAPIIEPRLDAASGQPQPWYIFGDPNQVDTLVYGHLSGEPEVMITNYMDPARLCYVTQAVVTFGAKDVDYVGMQKNPGA